MYALWSYMHVCQKYKTASALPLTLISFNISPSILCFQSGKCHCCSLQGISWSSCAAIELILRSKLLFHYISFALLYFPSAQAQDLSAKFQHKNQLSFRPELKVYLDHCTVIHFQINFVKLMLLFNTNCYNDIVLLTLAWANCGEG